MREYIFKACNTVPGIQEMPLNVKRGERQAIIVRVHDVVRYEIYIAQLLK